MKATFIDCPPFLHELYRGELAEIVPDLEINLGSPSRRRGDPRCSKAARSR